jgi:transcriptional regulator with XRE-family HTH domain
LPDLSSLMASILASNIKALREREGPTQTLFAERMEVSQGTVARWEHGAKPEYERIQRMAELAGVSVPEFTGQLLNSGRRQQFDGAAGLVLLPVQLPSEAVLTEMFDALLETMPASAVQVERAQKLAQLLPGALARTVSHPRAGTSSGDQPQPPQGDDEARPQSDRERPR